MVADCSIFHPMRNSIINRANARLIAAAPDLFAAAQRSALLIEEEIGVSPELKALLDAIAKAEGKA